MRYILAACCILVLLATAIWAAPAKPAAKAPAKAPARAPAKKPAAKPTPKPSPAPIKPVVPPAVHDSPFGVEVAATATDADFAAIRAAGIKWVRVQPDWTVMQPKPGPIDFKATDALIKAARKN